MFVLNRQGQSSAGRPARGLVHAARSGAGRETWIREALRKLRSQSGVDRFGVWLEVPKREDGSATRPVFFRGQVFDSSDSFSAEGWSRLSLEPLLPLAILGAGETAKFTQGTRPHGPIAGPAMGMAHGLWVPVTALGGLRGVLLLAAQESATRLPHELAEEVAEELALAMEWEEQRRLAAMRKGDLDFTAYIHARLTGDFAADSLFAEIAESCTQREQPSGIGAVFALIGECGSATALTAASGACPAGRLRILGLSGDAVWNRSVEHEPLGRLWHRAMKTCRIAEVEPGTQTLGRGIARITALPLVFEGQAQGVLVAGLPHGTSGPECMERLEQRALLGAQVLQQRAHFVKRADLEVRQRVLLECSEQSLLLVDRRGFLHRLSRGAREILAHDEAAVDVPCEKPAVQFAELFCALDGERASQWWQTSGGSEQAKAAQALRVLLKDGTEVECRRVGLPGEEISAVALQRIARTREERSKEDVEEELRQTVGWMEEGVVLFDETGNIRAANERFYRLLGLTTEETAQARNFEDLVQLAAPHAKDADHFEQSWRALTELLEGETQEELQMGWPVAQSIERCTREIVAPNGRRLGRVEAYREMSARRMFQARMAQTEKLALVGQRVSGIVHELSNPLTTILGYAQRLLPRTRDAENTMQRELRGILAEAERATGILRQLSRLSGEARGARAPISLNGVVDRSLELTRATLSGSLIRLRVEKEPSLPLIEGDFGQLQQVLLNLLQNAQQAIEQSGKGGLIGVRTGNAGDGRVRLEVWDDGPGVPSAIQARIFDPFFTTKPPGVGTGLGLAIVLSFVRQHGGTVNVVSAPRGGTRFLVELPAARTGGHRERASPEVKRFIPRRNGTVKTEPGEQRSPKVLVVEDEPTVGGLIADVLRDEGMCVDVLQDGHAALARAEAENYDLAICDLRMPGMDGQKFFSTLGQRHNPLQGRVLFVTGDVVAPRTQEFLERHGLPYVAKPFRVEELSRAVHELL